MLRTTSTNVLFYVSSQQGYIRQQRTTRRRLNIMVFTKIKTGQSEIRSSCSAFPTTTEQLLLLVLPLQPGQVINSASMSSLVRVSPTWSSPILPLHFSQVVTTSSFQVLYYHCTLVKSFHIILLKSNITTASWSSHST